MAFETRTHVNGGMLRQFAGQNVSIMLCVDDEAGTNLTATSTDDQRITVQLADSVGASNGDWIEVIGRPTGATAIRAKEVKHESTDLGIYAKLLLLHLGYSFWWRQYRLR